MKLVSNILFIVVFITILVNQASLAEEKEIDFADWLFGQGFYNEARFEYLKIIYDTLDETNIPIIFNKVAECYLASGNYGDGIRWCENMADRYRQNYFPELNITYSVLLMKLSHFEKSIELLKDKRLSNSSFNPRVNFLLGCANAHKWGLDNAISYWEKIPSNNQLYKITSSYIIETKKAKKIDFLNPTKGAILGFFPGLGYFYAGQKKTAVSALIVISLTVVGTYKCFDNNISGLGFLSGFLTIGWYSGSIYGSYWACERKNNFQKSQYLKNIQF